MRAHPPFGRSTWIITSLASIVTLVWVGGHGTESRPSATPAPATAALARTEAAARPPTAADIRAETPSASDDRPKPQQAASSVPAKRGVSGSIVAIDPETGQLGAPSPEQLRALELAGQDLAVSRTDEGLRKIVLANGTVVLHLDGRFEDHVIARVDRTGRLVMGCVHDLQGPATALRDSTAARGLEVE